MEKQSRCTIDVECWKRFTCVHCGRDFAYFSERVSKGMGNSPEAAEEHALAKAAAGARSNSNALPCPNCGEFQPDMVGSKRLVWHACMIAFAGGIVLPIWIEDSLHFDIVIVIVATMVFALAFMAVQCWINLRTFKDNSKAARARIDGLLRKDMLRIFDVSEQEGFVPTKRPCNPGIAFWLLLACQLACVLLLPLCEIVRIHEGWAYNPNCIPHAVGPGDEVTVRLPKSVDCLKNHWASQVDAWMELPEEANRLVPLAAKNRPKDWDGHIKIERGDGNRAANITATVVLPNEKNLEGKPIRARMTMLITSASLVPGMNQFVENREMLHFDEGIQLAVTGAGKAYQSILMWTFGAVTIVAFLSPLVCVFLASRLKYRALPVVVTVQKKAEVRRAPSTSVERQRGPWSIE